MGRQRFTPEFKDEAVRQVIERGDSVVDIAARLGVSSHSLYKWVKDAKPSGLTSPSSLADSLKKPALASDAGHTLTRVVRCHDDNLTNWIEG